jgi:HEPN domain-containing protein
MVESIATMLMRAAAIDAAACRVLDAAPGMDESVIGFHAQQACEKCLKAVLGHAGIAYERTHDLLRLMNLLRDNGIEQPAGTTWIDELMPYAVSARYGAIDTAALNRPRTRAAVDELLRWAQERCGGGPAAP